MAERPRQDENQWQADNQQGFGKMHYHHHGPGILGLSMEEIKAIQECRSDSTWKYSMPFALVSGAATYLAATRGFPRYGLRFGAFFPATIAAIFGSFLGRAAYVSSGSCQDKLAKLENSPIGETARKLNEAGVRLPPYLIVAGAEAGPWSGGQGPWGWWNGNQWDNRGFGSGYRYGHHVPSQNPWQTAPLDSGAAVTKGSQ